MSTPRFLVTTADLEQARLELRGNELRHLRARRLGRGAEILVTDGSGRLRRGRITEVGRESAQVLVSQAEPNIEDSSESPLRLELAQGALKGEKLDYVIEKATEIGVDRIVVFTSSRSVSRPDARRGERWQRLARSAAKQCQRKIVPTVVGPIGFQDVLALAPTQSRLIFWEQAGAVRLLPDLITPPQRLLAVVGPEGGFDPSEVAAARNEGFHVVGLGPRILRAETASVVALTLCQRLWGDF